MATLTISDKLLERIQAAAAHQQRPIDELLLEAIELVDPAADSLAVKPLTRDEEMQRLREALHGRVWTEADVIRYRSRIGFPRMAADERQRVVESLPVLDPPLSRTVIEMRDEERY